ncbi:MAG: DUF2892 domain-containing protein [Gammaproteobacteria bacterium]|nr:DUF2892 domain-containing protein [Gammaproteobacteria bacterium]
MENNMGDTDRAIRAIVGFIVMGAGFYFHSWWGVAGIYILATSMFNWCPPYALFGLNTRTLENS